MITRKLLSVSLVATALGAAGCGGGGRVAMAPEPEPMPIFLPGSDVLIDRPSSGERFTLGDKMRQDFDGERDPDPDFVGLFPGIVTTSASYGTDGEAPGRVNAIYPVTELMRSTDTPSVDTVDFKVKGERNNPRDTTIETWETTFTSKPDRETSTILRHKNFQQESLEGGRTLHVDLYSDYNETILDGDWLAAGVWITVPEDGENGDFAVGAWSHGSNPFNVLNLEGLTGTATYAGKAAGRYGQRRGDRVTAGRFEADAMLTADFDVEVMETPLTTSHFGTIEGELSNFMVDGASESDWEVNLDTAALDGRTPVYGNRISCCGGQIRGETSGEANGNELKGFWNGRFYGRDADTNNPGSIAGIFGAADTDGAANDHELTLIGVFGAHLEQQQ